MSTAGMRAVRIHGFGDETVLVVVTDADPRRQGEFAVSDPRSRAVRSAG
ncbi:hypothetical protein [Pseudonocardia sp. GCM10023141]